MYMSFPTSLVSAVIYGEGCESVGVSIRILRKQCQDRLGSFFGGRATNKLALST